MLCQKKILVPLFYLIFNYTFSQKKCIKVLEVHKIKYYYVYKAFNCQRNDTITLISSKLDKEFKKIELLKNNCYIVDTRLRSAIKISEIRHFITKHAITIIEDIQISDKNNLPVLILDSKMVECGDIEYEN